MADSEVSIKVTTINGRHHARLLKDDRVLDEMACEERADIGYICRTMLRWHDKCGGTSLFAHAARTRMWNLDKYPTIPNERRGRIWTRHQLEIMKEKNKIKKDKTVNG